MSKHTPGPWSINTAGGAKKGEPFRITEIYVYAPHVQDDTAICADIIDPITQEPSEANARLIAAAPELLSALKDIIGWVPGAAAWHTDAPIKAVERARAAIDKATRAE